MIRDLEKMLLAILLGNVIYLLVRPYLPSILDHNVFRVDAGLVVDFVICVALYVGIRKVL